MKRILVFSGTDWLLPRPGADATYLKEVFSRVAEHENHVALLSHRPLPLPGRKRYPRIEVGESVQIARLGLRYFYRYMALLFLQRLMKEHPDGPPYDLIVDCVHGRPLPIEQHTDTPVLPLVFHLKRGFRVGEEVPGPVIAPTPKVYDRLQQAGMPEKYIVRAFFPENRTDTKQWGKTASLVLATIENMQGDA